MILILIWLFAAPAWSSSSSSSLLFTTLHDAYSPKSSPSSSAWPVGGVSVALHQGVSLCRHSLQGANGSALFSADLLYCQIAAARQLPVNESVTVPLFSVTAANAVAIGPVLFFMGSAERRPANIDSFVGHNVTTSVDDWLVTFCAQPQRLWKGFGFANGLFLTFGLCSEATAELTFARNVTAQVGAVRAHGEKDLWMAVQKSATAKFADSLWSSTFSIAFSSLALLDDAFEPPAQDPADWSSLFNDTQSAAFRSTLNTAAVELVNLTGSSVDDIWWNAAHAIVRTASPLILSLFNMTESEARASALFRNYASAYAQAPTPLDACVFDELKHYVGGLRPNASSPLVTERTRASLWTAISTTKRFICRIFLDLGGVALNSTLIPPTTAPATTTAGNTTTMTTPSNTTTTTPMPTTAPPSPPNWSRRGAIAGVVRSTLKWVDLLHCSFNTTDGCGANGLCQPWSVVTRDLPVTSAGCACAPGWSGPLCTVPPVTTTVTTTTTTTTTTAAPTTTTTTAATTPAPCVAPTPLPTTGAPTPVPTTVLNLLCPNGCSLHGLCNSLTGKCSCDLVPGTNLHFDGPDCSLTPCSAGCKAAETCDQEDGGVCRSVCLLPSDCGKNAVCFRADNSTVSFCRCVDAWGGASCSWPVPMTTKDRKSVV